MAMAAAPGPREKVLTDIDEQILMCAICMERFKSPKILPCYHTFCEPCLKEWVKTNNGQLICPTCKELHPLPSGGVKAITNNRFINDLLQLISDINPDAEKSLCEVCQKEARFWCQDCGEFFCDECIRTHKIMRLLRDHKLITVEEYDEKMSSQHFRMIQPRFCESHPSAQLEFYCDTCQVPTCLKCTVVKHKASQHDIISIESALEKYMPTMKQYTKTVEQKVIDLKQTQIKTRDTGKDYKEKKTVAESRIKNLSKKVIDGVKKQEAKLLAEVNEMYAPNCKQIDSKIETLEHKIVNAESMQSYMNHLLTFGGPVDIMSAKKEMEQRLGQCDLHDASDDDLESDLVFKENPRCLQVMLGCIVNEKTDNQRVENAKQADGALGVLDAGGQFTTQTAKYNQTVAELSESHGLVREDMSSQVEIDVKGGRHNWETGQSESGQNQFLVAGQLSVGQCDLIKRATVGEDMLSYIFHVCGDWLKKMESTHGVEFVWSGSEDLTIKSAKGNSKCTPQSLDAVYEKCVTSVQKLHSKMISKDVDLTGKAISSSISQAIKDTHSKYRKVLIKQTGNKKFRVLGETEEVKVAMETFCSYLGVDVPTSRYGEKGKRHVTYAQIQRSNSLSSDKRGVLLEFEFGRVQKTKVSICQGDITKQNVDVIANPANDRLDHGGGVAGAIVKAGGNSIQKDSDDIIARRQGRPLELSEVVYTKAGTLPSRFVLHTVGPKWTGRNEQTVRDALYRCCTNLLSLAEDLKARSIAIPAIGTGIYGVPKDVCAEVMCHAVFDYFDNRTGTGTLAEVVFIDIDVRTVESFVSMFSDTLDKYGIPYTRPSDFGADTLFVRKESSVDGSQYSKGAASGYGATAGAGEFTGLPCQVKNVAKRWSAVVGGNTSTSKTTSKGAFPKPRSKRENKRSNLSSL